MEGRTIAEIAAKRVGELQRGVFTILLDQPAGLPAREVLHRMEQRSNRTKTDGDYEVRSGLSV